MARTLSGDRAGFWPARVSPIWAIARVPLSNPAAAPGAFWWIGGPGFCVFAPADRRWRRRSGSASGSGGVRAELAARAARPGRLETVQKVLTRKSGSRCPVPLDARHGGLT
jgi:hypothetical protein